MYLEQIGIITNLNQSRKIWKYLDKNKKQNENFFSKKYVFIFLNNFQYNHIIFIIMILKLEFCLTITNLKK